MNKHLKHLIEIASVDKEIDSFEPRISQVREELNKILTQKDELTKSIADYNDEKRNIELKRQKSELHLQEQSLKLEEIAKKGKLIKSEKEMKALSLEEEIAKEQITFSNEEILHLDKLQESKNDEILDLAKQITKLDEEQKKIEKEVYSKIEEIDSQRQKVFKTKEMLVATMDQKIITFYEKIRKWARNTSVVPVYKQACGGCFIRINDKIYSEVIKSEEIITCPHCGRILYAEIKA